RRLDAQRSENLPAEIAEGRFTPWRELPAQNFLDDLEIARRVVELSPRRVNRREIHGKPVLVADAAGINRRVTRRQARCLVEQLANRDPALSRVVTPLLQRFRGRLIQLEQAVRPRGK